MSSLGNQQDDRPARFLMAIEKKTNEPDVDKSKGNPTYQGCAQ